MQIISMNTDGLFYKCDSEEESQRVRAAMERFAAQIECPIEFTNIAEHRQEHINSYQQVIVNEDGSREVKGKGAWNPDPGINADHNATVCAKAMAQHLLDGTDIREFIETAAKEERFLEFTSMQSSRSSTIRVGGEPVGGMIRVYHSTIAEDELPAITIDPAGKSPEKRVARGCAYAAGLDWPEDLDIEWYIDETLRRMEQSSTEFSPQHNVLARQLEAKGIQVRGTGGGSARSKRTAGGIPANFAGCKELEVFIGGSSGLVAIEAGEISRDYGSLVLETSAFEIHWLDKLAEHGITPKSLEAGMLYHFAKGWFGITSAVPAPEIADRDPEILDNDAFLEAMFGVEADEALIVASTKPQDAMDWTAGPRRYYPNREHLDPESSCYASISLVTPIEQGLDANGDKHLVYRRKKSEHRATYCVMLDDIGSKAKDPVEYGFGPPTVKIETSPNNFQYLYKLSTPITNRAAAQQLIDLLVRGVERDGKCIPVTDAGAGDVMRLFRMPFGSNRKPSLDEPFRTRVHEMDFSRTYTADEIAGWLGGHIDWTATEPVRERNIADEATVAEHPLMLALAAEGLLKGRGREGWFEIVCPWVNQHSKGDDSGTKVVIDDSGTWHFYCHHGSCREGAGGRDKHTTFDLFDWLKERGHDVTHPYRARDLFEGFDTSKLSFPDQTTGAEEVAGVDMGFTESDIDVLSPPGIAGDICRMMAKRAFRPLPEAYVLFSLQLLALAGMQHKTPHGARFNLITILIAVTAAGKETGYTVLVDLAKRIGRTAHISNEPRSDKDIYQTALETEGAMLFVVDEAQKFFRAVSNRNASQYTAGMLDLLMEVVTKETLMFTSLHRRNFTKEIKDEIRRVDTRLGKDGIDPDDKRILTATREKLERQLGYLQNGIDSPFAAMAAASTPDGLETLISASNVEKGLIGRGLVLRASSQRRRKSRTRSKAIDHKLLVRLQNIAQSPAEEISLSEDAERRLEEISEYYEADERLNHDSLGGLYARAEERIVQLAAVLAVETQEISVEFLDYAKALFERHLEDVGLMRSINEANETPRNLRSAQAIADLTGETILRTLTRADDWIYASTVKNECRKRIDEIAEDIAQKPQNGAVYDAIWAHMVSTGWIEVDGKRARAAK